MAVTKTVSNRMKYELGKGAVDFSSDSFKAILTNTSFVFDKDNDETYSDVTSDEISNGNGYTTCGAALVVGTAWNQDDSNDMGEIEFNDVTWTASGDDIEEFNGLLVYDDTHASKIVVGHIDFGEDIEITDGNHFTCKEIGFNLV